MFYCETNFTDKSMPHFENEMRWQLLEENLITTNTAIVNK